MSSNSGSTAFATCFDWKPCCRFNAAEGKHLVEYDDGEKEWLDLPAELVSLPGCSGPSTAANVSRQPFTVHRGLLDPGRGTGLPGMIHLRGRFLQPIMVLFCASCWARLADLHGLCCALVQQCSVVPWHA